MYHSGRPFPVAFGDEMGLKPGFGCHSLLADGTAPFLVIPNFDEFFPSLCAVEHFFSVTFLIITRPHFIKRVSVSGDFSILSYFGVCRIFQFEEFFIESFTAKGWRRRKRPHSIVNFVPILFGNPFLPFPLVSTARPPP